MGAVHMKKVIFVGGTEYSGSTFFHMILANDPHGLAIGEVHNFFRPSRPYHFQMHCSCGEQPGKLWLDVKNEGETRLYAALFDAFPEVDYIVDSSKNPLWIHDQMQHLERQGIATQNILIWKTPYELAHSFQKRGDVNKWQRSWEVYHRIYFTLIEQWRAISYGGFTNERSLLTSACAYLQLADFPGKERYWEREQHVLGGNPSARVHLYAEDNPNFKENIERSSSRIDVAEAGTHRRIRYSAVVEPSLQALVNEQIENNSMITPILNMLQSRDVGNRPSDIEKDFSHLQMSSSAVQLRRVKQIARRQKAALLHQLHLEQDR